ncbi:glutamate receptor subunit protein glur6 [Plakobranchus ocellatus]|uniref:Glutamate receptor subunit protein glur6 n=1 Tax=Plakobranchus ocellatus TaxID=259542 RepID=A0AAV3ZTR5_9GAST|nr:glutamate receptor subunit protein glur6 [Plakobranchus ocellatus]
MAAVRNYRYSASLNFPVAIQLVCLSLSWITASTVATDQSLSAAELSDLLLFPNFIDTTEPSIQDGLLAATEQTPVYVIGTIHSKDAGPSLQVQQSILRQVNNRNLSISRVTLEDYGSDDVSSFENAVQTLRTVRPDAVIGHYHWTYAVATEHLRIPYFVTSLTPRDQEASPFLIQLFPSGAVFAHAAEDVLQYYKLKKVAVFHDTEIGKAVLERLAQRTWMETTGFYVTEKTASKIRDHLKMVRAHYYNTVVAILNPENTRYLLDQGLSLSMFSPPHKWILLNMGLSLSMFSPPHKWILLNMGLSEYALQDYVDSRANISVLRLMMDIGNSESCPLSQADMRLETVAFHDAVQLFAEMKASQNPNQKKLSMRRTVKNLQIDGCTGKLVFSKFGRRRENFLQVMTLQGYLTGAGSSGREHKVWDWDEKEPSTPAENKRWSQQWSGTWRSGPEKLNQRMEPFRSYSALSHSDANVFPDTPLRVTINIVPPFTQRKTEKSLDTGHPIYEGFCIDILIEMSKLLGFKYNITEVPDGKFGSLKPPPRGWTGMIRQLVDKVVWSAIFVAFVGTSLMLFAVSRVNSDRQAKYAHNLRESFWYIWGTLLRGSLTGSPHAISSRIVSSAWWFFALIISSIYTANLAAFLTITIADVGINTAQDLALQDEFDYGTVEGSQTETFFKHTQMTYYARMWAHMSVLSPQSMSRRVENGFERVRKGKYAFIWDSPTIRYTISNDCDLMEIGSPFDLKGYGFAYQKNAPYGEKLSWALLMMQDNSVLYKLERKWWRPQICPSQKQSAKTKSLDLETVAGMYVVILSGALISMIICSLQFLYGRFTKRRKQRKKERGERQDSDDQLSREENNTKAGYPPVQKSTPGDNEITYANHSPSYFGNPEDWKLKYDSY